LITLNKFSVLLKKKNRDGFCEKRITGFQYTWASN
jgi:hypothetical protein